MVSRLSRIVLDRLTVIEYLKDDFNLTLSNSVLQQNLFQKFTGEYGMNWMNCNSNPFGTSDWRNCNYTSIGKDYESRTQSNVNNIREQIIDLANRTDMQINQLNATQRNTNSEIQRLQYLSIFSFDTLNIREFLIDALDNLQTMHANLLGIDKSLESFSFANFQTYGNNLNQEGFERKLEEAVNVLQVEKQSVEQSNNKLDDQKMRINSMAQKIADRLEQPTHRGERFL